MIRKILIDTLVLIGLAGCVYAALWLPMVLQ